MVTYGPWTQAPDYTKQAVAYFPVNIESVASAKIVREEPPPPDPGAISEVVETSREAWGDTTGTGSGPLAFYYEGDAGPFPRSLYIARRSYGLVTFSAYSQSLNGWVPSVPPDAIGYEWESGAPPGMQRSEVVSLTWDMPSTSFDLDRVSVGPTGGQWTTEVRPVFDLVFASQSDQSQTGVDGVVSWGEDVSGQGNVVKSIGPEPHGATRVDPIDLTPHLFGPPEAGYAALIREVELGVPITPTLDSDNSGGWDIGHAYNLSIPPVYTFRPPRYRLVYPDGGGDPPPTVLRQAPNRIVQRGNDGLGVTGGRRIIGAKTVQSSNRRGTAIR